MSDSADSADDEQASGPVAGERLAEARRLRQITLPQIARELHLDEARVQALEENRFDLLGAPVFAKGHLRKYAEMVGVSIDDVMADYYTLNRATGAPPVVGPPRDRPPRSVELSPKLLLIPLFIALAAAGWWVYTLVSAPGAAGGDAAPGIRQPQSGTSSPVAAPPAAAGDSPAATSAMPAAASPSDAPDDAADDRPAEVTGQAAAATDDAGLAAAAPVQDNPAPLPAAGTVSIELAYSGDCWTEVTDANGERLFFDLGRSGRRVSVSGPPPLRVLLGNSDNVSVSVNGTPYTIAARDRRGETARLTINP